jgi:hypothetical protein
MELRKRFPDDELPPAIAVVIDNIHDSYLVVTIDELLRLYWERLKKPHLKGSRQFTFQVEWRAGGYSLVMPGNRPNIPLTHVNSIQSVVLLLKTLRGS